MLVASYVIVSIGDIVSRKVWYPKYFFPIGFEAVGFDSCVWLISSLFLFLLKSCE
jgi:hypothetical protein